MKRILGCFVILGVVAVLSTPAGADGDPPGVLELYIEGEITPRTQGYDALAWYEAYHVDSRFRKGEFDRVPYETRWINRAVALTLAYTTAEGRDRPWLKRALELAFWQAIQVKRQVSAGLDSYWVEMLMSNDAPACLTPSEVDDLLTIDRVLRKMETADASRGGDL